MLFSTRNTDKSSHFRFPNEPRLKEQWIDATGRTDWMPTKTSTICSKHFSEKDYVPKKSGHRYLKSEAIPQEKVVRILSVSVCIIITYSSPLRSK